MYCPNCGKQNGDNARYCSGCGIPLALSETGADTHNKKKPVFKTAVIISVAIVFSVAVACAYFVPSIVKLLSERPSVRSETENQVEAGDIEGVVISKRGEPCVSFILPSDKRIEDVVDREITRKGTIVTEELTGEYVELDDGDGYISWVDNVYRYVPSVKISTIMLTNGSLPKFAYPTPDPFNGVLDPSDVDELENRYGIVLNL